MFAATAALLLAAVTAAPAETQPVLYEFTAPWCKACQEMKPAIQRVKTAGVRVETLNLDDHREFAKTAGISQIPCFVLVRDNKEIDRKVGALSAEELWDWYQRTSYALQNQPVAGAANSLAPATAAAISSPAQPPIANNPAAVAPATAIGPTQATPINSVASVLPSNGARVPATVNEQAVQRAIAATVRLRIEDAEGRSFGTGTIIDVHQDEALVLTCGHIFRESKGKGKIYCDLFAAGAPQNIVGKVISYDLRRDIGLISIRPGVKVAPMLVGSTGSRARKAQKIFSVGCNRGDDPTVIRNQIIDVNRYHGPANLVVGGRPIDGRSGGGLFDANGTLIGVCNAADPELDEGLYAALDNIHTELNIAGLSFIYERRAPKASAVASQPHIAPAARVAAITSPATSVENATPGEDTELICIVRSRSQPDQPDRMLILDRPSGDLLSRISQEASRRSASAEVNLHVPRSQDN